MDELVIIGFAVFLVSIFVGRFIGENALKRLDDKKKAQLLDSFSKYRVFHILPLIFLIAFLFVGLKLYPEASLIINGVFIVFLVVFIIVTNIFMFEKIKHIELSKMFIRQFVISRLVQYVGLAILFYATIKVLLRA